MDQREALKVREGGETDRCLTTSVGKGGADVMGGGRNSRE